MRVPTRLFRVFHGGALFLFGASCVTAVYAAPHRASSDVTILTTGWLLRSSCDMNATGAQISAAGFSTDGWHKTNVPSTVVAALVADGTYPDPYYSDNLRKIPGTTYPIGRNFSRMPMPKESPFHCSWWYRTTFEANPSANERVWLHFGGINNHANIWVNGKEVADEKSVAGAYRTYDFDVTPYVSAGQSNILAVETIAQSEKDLGINWVDWNPAPPDKDMGLWRGVSAEITGPVTVRHPFVATHFSDASLGTAELTVEAEVCNATDKPVTGMLEASLESLRLSQKVTLPANEVRAVRFTPDQFSQLRINHPEVWWPRQMGDAKLHPLSLRFTIGKQVSDSASIRYGIREITSQLDAQNHRLFLVNGKKILIRGGGWSPDMLLRQDLDRLQSEFQYVRDMNLNTIRLEGKLETDEFYNLADEQGVLIMAGWCCCDIWEEWKKWQPSDLEIATASLHSQIMRMRSHPSMLVWLNGSDNPPPADVEKAYIQVLKDADWPNPFISSASQAPTTVTGPSGVKMTGPYDYVPPDYWSVDPGKYGGAWGFNTETGPGPAVPVIGCLRKMLPEDAIDPKNPLWNYHAGSEGFKDLSHFDGAMDAIYGPAKGMDEYELKSQAMAYDGERAMFEAYSGQKYAATGVIQWMLNNAWPSLIWHLFDYYLQPGGGYFGTKKACEPLHVQYGYGDSSVRVVNSRYEPASNLTVTAKVYDVNLQEKFSKQANASVDADGVATVLTFPNEAFNPPSPVYFVNLQLTDQNGKMVSTNFYWLSSKKDTYNWGKTTYRFTPVSDYEDMTALAALPKAGAMSASAGLEGDTEAQKVRVMLRNPSDHLAFQVHLAIQGGPGQMEILPVLWEDNYFELMPGESREITAEFPQTGALKNGAHLTVNGWNIESTTVPISANTASVQSPAPTSKDR